LLLTSYLPKSCFQFYRNPMCKDSSASSRSMPQQPHRQQSGEAAEQPSKQRQLWEQREHAEPCFSSFMDLLDELYFDTLHLLDVDTLRAIDVTCRHLRARNNSQLGVWRALGITNFEGMEAGTRGFLDPRAENFGQLQKYARVDWKLRYHEFGRSLSTFCTPFSGNTIADVSCDGGLANFSCRLWYDAVTESGVYLELEVVSNPDNLSLAVQDDIEEGHRGSLTFSPDTGAVIRERIVRYNPRKCEGSHVQPLTSIDDGTVFHGFIGLFFKAGKFAFFRRVRSEAVGDKEGELHPWECTGFVSDLEAWAKGRWIRPCVAFRDSGAYDIRISSISKEPPVPFAQWPSNASWILRNWTTQEWEVEEEEE